MKFSATPGAIQAPAPLFGEHTREVLAEAGFSAAEIEDSVERIEVAIVEDYPEVAALFVKPQSAEEWKARHSRIAEASSPELRERTARRHALRERFRMDAG